MAWVKRLQEIVRSANERQERYEEVKNRLSNLRASYMQVWDEKDLSEDPTYKRQKEEELRKIKAKYDELYGIFREMWPDD